MSFRLLIPLVVTFQLLGCALPQITPEQRATNLKRWQSQNCTFDQGFETGHRDASANQQMNGQRISQHCPGDLGEQYMNGYRKGFLAAKNSGPSVIIVNPQDGKN